MLSEEETKRFDTAISEEIEPVDPKSASLYAQALSLASEASYPLVGDKCECGCGDLLYVTCSGCDKDMTLACFDRHDCPAEAKKKG